MSSMVAESTVKDQNEMLNMIMTISKVADELNDKNKKLRDSISNISAIIEETTAKDEEITATILTLTGEGK